MFLMFHFFGLKTIWMANSVTSKKSPNVYKCCPKMISPAKWKTLITFQKLPKNVGDLGKIMVATGFESCPKCNKSANLVTLMAKYFFHKIGQCAAVITFWHEKETSSTTSSVSALGSCKTLGTIKTCSKILFE